MKKYLIIFAASFLLMVTSCNDFLDQAAEGQLDESVVFSNYTSCRGYLDNCYNALNDYTRWDAQTAQRPHVACISDEAVSTYNSSVTNVINAGNWYGQTSAVEVGYNDNEVGNFKGRVISNAFFSLRIANKIIAKIDNTQFTDEEKANLKGQAYFFRAWYYFEIIRRWGGMPIFDKVYATDDNLDFPRLSYHESTKWLISDLDMAISLLPNSWPEAELGRTTKAAAYALKGMAALYAASPLMCNPIDKIELRDYDVQWAKDAAQYAYNTITYINAELPAKGLVGLGLSTRTKQDSAYRSISYHYPNFVSNEALWFKNRTGQTRDEDIAIHFQNSRWSGRTGNYGTAISTPSQNLVDKFEVINPIDNKAYPISHPNSGYSLTKPYVNRDPRFYLNVLYPGAKHGTDASSNPVYLEPWIGGKDYNAVFANSVPTGYMCIKWWWPEANFAGNPKTAAYNKYYYSCSFIRTTQVYLDFAEAMNEAYGPNDPHIYGMSAVQAINLLRSRVGMPPVLDEYTTDKVEFRKRIRNERAIELMYENHRWFDIRRWMIAYDLFNISGDPYPMKKIQVTDLTPTQANVSLKSFSYSVGGIIETQRVFQLKHYWYPVAADHTDQLFNFKQNPGW